MFAIEVEHLKKYFHDIKAVDDISFQVEQGELFGFLGVNGAGKSTTINILCTLLGMTDGSAKVCGYDVNKESNLVRRQIGVVFQENTLDDFLTIRENLRLRGALYEKDSRKIERNIQEVTEILEIGDLLDRQFIKLSGGQKRRCEIAKSLMNTPQLLFLDEPTTGLDPATRKYVWKSIERLREEKNMTVFLTTHYMEEATLAQHLCIMDDGKIIMKGTPSEIKHQYANDIMKVYTEQIDQLAQELKGKNVSCEKITNGVSVKLSSTKQAFEIFPQIHTPCDGVEVIQGTLDDAFINLTGKKSEDE